MKGKTLKALIVSLIAAMLIFIPVMAAPQTAQTVEAATNKLVNVSITPTYHQSVARSQLKLINDFRASNPGYKDENDKMIYNGKKKKLVYDYTLEQYAMQRAAEIILKFSHDRPKGGTRSGVLGYLGIGENLCIDTMHVGTKEEAHRLFREDDKPYDKQGHRRMMLSVPAEFDAVGIAFVEYEGEYFWVQEYGVTNSPNTKETQPVNGKKVMNVEIGTDYIEDKNIEPIKLTINDEDTKGLTQDKTVRINYGYFTYPYGYWDLNVTGEWKSNNEKIAKVIKANNKYKVKATGNGTTTIDLVGSNGDVYKSMKVTVDTIEKVPEVFFFDNLLTYNTGESSKISYVLLPENATNKKVQWTSSDTSIATVDANGKVKALKAGKAKITGKTVSGGLTYTGDVIVSDINVTGDVIVSDINVTGVKLNKATVTINQSGTETLKATIAPSDATNKNVSWSSNNTKIATVDKSGNVKAVGAGTAIITCKTADGGKTSTCKVTVKTVPVTGVTVSPTSMTMKKGDSKKITATISPSNATNKNVTWSSSNTKIATVDKSGNVKAVGAGTATITCKTVDGGKTAMCKVNVIIPVTGITLNYKESTLGIGESEKLKATITPSNATNKTISWSSSNTAVATVDKNGNVKALKAGAAVITAKTASEGKTATFKLKVLKNTDNGVMNLFLRDKAEWYYVEKGKIKPNYTGFGSNSNGDWYIENGKVTFKKNGIIHGVLKGVDGWWYVKDSKVQYLTTIDQNENGWWYIKNGKVDFSYTGIKNNVNGWWYIKDGKVDFNYTGFAKNENGWWYIENGEVTFKKNSIIQGTVNGINAWWYVKDSKVTFETTITNNENGWWYVKDGKVDFSYTGIRNNVNGWWYIKNGQVDFNYTGFAQNENGWWYCEKGKVTFKYNGKVKGTINGKTATYTVKDSKVML